MPPNEAVQNNSISEQYLDSHLEIKIGLDLDLQ